MYDNIEFVICCAGESSRNFPHSKGIPHKSLMPFGDVRLIDHVLGDIIRMGGRHITIVCSNEEVVKLFQRALQNDTKIVEKLNKKGKKEIAEILQSTFLPPETDLKFVIQDEPLGTAHVLYCAKEAIDNRHVVLIFPDDITISNNSHTSHIQRFTDDFLTNPKQILLTGLWREDVSNNAILVNKRLIEKPKTPINHIASFSPYILPNEIIQYIKNNFEQRIKKAKETGTEWLYVDAINDFLDNGGEKAGFFIKMFLMDEKDFILDTGTLPLYEKGQLYALLKLSKFSEENKKFVEKILKEK